MGKMWPQWPPASGITAECLATMWSYTYLQSQSLMLCQKCISSKYRAMWYTGEGWWGSKGSRCTLVSITLKRMVTFTQSYTKFEKVKPAADRGSSLPTAHPNPSFPKSKRGPSLFFAALGLPCGEYASSLLQGAFSSCGQQGYSQLQCNSFSLQ